MNEQVAKALAKQEAKREKKLLRKKAWDELYYKKPKEGEEDPTLIQEIKQAKKNLGKERNNGESSANQTTMELWNTPSFHIIFVNASAGLCSNWKNTVTASAGDRGSGVFLNVKQIKTWFGCCLLCSLFYFSF